jgi:tRNA U34 5-methylaminomethyl-2-thiouridine-forming methyltransferase MnmC
LENDWVPADVLRQLQPETWIANRQLAESLVAFRQQLPSRVDDGTYQWIAGDKQKVTIHVGDALTHPYDAELTFDAIYFDPFSPASNPNLWKADLLARLARVLKPSGRLVTYCVSRQVRERLTEVGFEIRRVPGPPGGKREVLIASLRRHD